MTIYVDSAKIPATVGRIRAKWSHLTADDQDELHAFAAQLGLKRQWFQTCRNTRSCPPEACPHWHYDVTEPKRDEALKLGAKLIDMRELGALISARRAAMRAASASSEPAPAADTTMPVPPVHPPVKRGVCGVPDCPTPRPASLYLCGWRCLPHSPAQIHATLAAAAAAAAATKADESPAGDPPAEVEWPVPNPPTRRYSPERQQHSWTKVKEHHKVCGHCRVWVINQTENHHKWWQTWRWPDGTEGTNVDDQYPKLPKCPGPKETT